MSRLRGGVVMNCSPVLPADEGLRLESDENDEYDHWFRGYATNRVTG